jgi:hypothetical protein
MNQTNIPMEEKKPVLRIVYNWLDNQPAGREFGPRDLQKYVRQSTNGKRNPQDGTITRYIRAYNAQGGHVKNVSRSKSIYRIEDPDQWAEDILDEIEEAEKKGAGE